MNSHLFYSVLLRRVAMVLLREKSPYLTRKFLQYARDFREKFQKPEFYYAKIFEFPSLENFWRSAAGVFQFLETTEQ